MLIPGGKVRVALKTPWTDGTRALVFTHPELIEKLAALVPPARAHQTRYCGVLAPNAHMRAEIIPTPPPAEPCEHGKDDAAALAGPSWQSLLKRAFGWDVLECPRCGDRMKLLGAVTERAAIRTHLAARGLDPDPPQRAPPPPTAQPEFDLEFP